MASIQDSYLSGSNIDFIEGLYARYLEDPSSIDPSWREIFDQQSREGRPIFLNGKGSALRRAEAEAVVQRPSAPAPNMGPPSRVDQTVYPFWPLGHLAAQLD